MEIRSCQNCKEDFTIESDDFSFYEKIEVPPPTFCFPCRLQRKLIFKNERGLYMATCDMCTKQTLSVVKNSSDQKLYCLSCWTSDAWDALVYEKEYDYSSPFFSQIKDLFHQVPVRALTASSSSIVNIYYCNTSSNLKNCYLVYGSNDAEDCMYGTELIDGSYRCIDCMIVSGVTNAYQCINCDSSQNIRFCIDCKNCLDVSYSKNLSNCSDCVGCCNLKNKRYCIWNEQYTKEEYEEKIAELSLHTAGAQRALLEKAKIFFLTFPVKYMHGFSNKDVTGDYIYQSKNIRTSCIVTESEDCAYCYNIVVKGAKDCMDYSDWGDQATEIYESQSCGANVAKLKFCQFVTRNSMECEYSIHCYNCQYLFGCVGLRSKKYCILNKQYSKEEYFEKVEKIKKHMDEMPYIDREKRVYAYGEFFPSEFSPFAYNDTVAQDTFFLSKESAVKAGYRWSERFRNTGEAMSSCDLPESIRDTDLQIINETLECANKSKTDIHPYCTENYKITTEEFLFYKRLDIPLPRHCFNCRFYERLHFKNPPVLWDRGCMREGCSNIFKTSYSPDRAEIVYCESCYQKEIL